MSRKNKNTLGSSTVTYLTLDLFSRLASYLLAIGLAYILLPADYGLWAVLLSAVALLGQFFSSPFAPAAGRWYFDRKNIEFGSIVFTLGISQLAFIVVTSFAFFIYLGSYTGHQSEPDLIAKYGRVLLVSAALSSLPAIPLATYISRRESRKAGWLGFWVALFPALGMWGFAVLEPTVGSVLFGLLAGQSLVGLIGVFLLWKMSTPIFKEKELIVLLAYGFPLVPHVLGMWALGSADRFLVHWFAGDKSVAAYHVAYLAGFAVLILGQAFAKSWQPFYLADATRIRSATNEREFGRLKARIARQSFTVGICISLFGVLVGIWANEVLGILLPTSYESALTDAIIIVAGNVFLSLYLLPLRVLHFQKATVRIAALTLLAVTLNIALNILWIPQLNTTGAALATLVSHFFIFISTCLIAFRTRDPLMPIRSWVKLLGITVFLFPAFYVDRSGMDPIVGMPIKIILTCLLFLVLFRTNIFHRITRDLAFNRFTNG